jgi:hypothetical protein
MSADKPYKILRSQTGGHGLRVQPNAEDRKRRLEEVEIQSKYRRFDSGKRTREENLHYARAEEARRVEERIALALLSVDDKDAVANEIPNETGFDQFEAEQYRLFDTVYKNLPIKTKRREVCQLN